MTTPRVLVRNAGSEKQVRAAKETVQFRQQQADARLIGLLSTYEGRWWMWDHLGTFGIRDVRQGLKGRELRELQGRRVLGATLELEIIRVAPDSYVLMQRESIDREKQATEPKPRTDEPFEEFEDDGN